MPDRTTFTDYETKITAAWLNTADATLIDALGAATNPEEVRAFLEVIQDAPVDGTQYVRVNASWSAAQFPAFSHQDLDDRDLSAQHPISAIDGLTDALTALATDARIDALQHSELGGRSASGQHPIGAITDLASTLSGLNGDIGDVAGDLADLDSATKNAARLNTGTLATARMGSGTANSSTFLRGDNSWATPPGGGGVEFTAGDSLWYDADTETLHNPADTGGFENRTSTSLVFASNQFDLTWVSDFRVWSASAVFEFDATESVAVPNTTGFYFLAIDATGALGCSTDSWEILDATAPVATLYFNATNPTEYVLSDERHSYKRNMSAHRTAHKAIGAYIDLPGDLVGTFGDTNGSISVVAGSFFDEDLEHAFEGTLTQAKTVYKDASGWRVRALASDYRMLDTGVLQYNNGTSLASPGVNDYVNYWVYAVPEVVGAGAATGALHVLVGQVLHTAIATALAETVDTLSLPPWIAAEARALYRVTLRRTSGTPAGDIYQTPTDLRFTKISGGVTVSGAFLPTSLPEGNLWVGNASGVAVASAVVASGTAVAASPILTLTQTWNNAAVAFQGLAVAVTDTASLAASLLLDLAVGGATKFGITKGGGVYSYGVTGSNYERGAFDWETTANVLTVGAQKSGSGTLRDLNLVGKNVGINTQGGALATDATTGFFLVGSCAGAPTGTPASVPTGMIPMVVDSSNGELYIYT